MSNSDTERMTTLLRRQRDGDRAARDELFTLLYDDLKHLGHRLLRNESQSPFQTTTLVHQTYLRLVGGAGDIEDRRHFLGHAATAMRHILIDEARRRRAAIRGGGREPTRMEDCVMSAEGPSLELLALDLALQKLAEIDGERVKIVELLYFTGLTLAEVGEQLALSRATVTRRWAITRAWLRQEIGCEDSKGHHESR